MHAAASASVWLGRLVTTPFRISALAAHGQRDRAALVEQGPEHEGAPPFLPCLAVGIKEISAVAFCCRWLMLRAGGRLCVQRPQLPRCGNDLEAKKVGHNQARYDRRIFLQLRCTVRLLAVPSEASACYIRHIGLMHAVATDSAGRGVSPAAALHGALRPESLTRSVALAAFSVASSRKHCSSRARESDMKRPRGA